MKVIIVTKVEQNLIRKNILKRKKMGCEINVIYIAIHIHFIHADIFIPAYHTLTM
jgi:hypothetical protein